MALLTGTGLRINRYCSMADFPFFKMAAVRHLDFQKLEISTSGPVRRPNMRHRTKFREDRSNRSGDMADFRFFKMAAAAILDFGNIKFFNGWDAQEGRTSSVCQILSKLLKTWLRYGDFSIFQDGGRPPSWIGSTRVGTTHEEYLVVLSLIHI